MILEYHRPNTIQEALTLLARSQPVTVPMGGGSLLNQPSAEPVAVVDLQALGLNTFERRGNSLLVGATVSLCSLIDGTTNPEYSLPAALSRAVLHEATNNSRNVATVAGTLVGADGRSPFTTALLAVDAKLAILPGRLDDIEPLEEEGQFHPEIGTPAILSLGDLLPLRPQRVRGRLIIQVILPLNVRLEYDYVARTPADRPIVCVAVARWPSGRTRISLGGYGAAPILAMDGPEPEGAEIAAGDAYHQAGDEWATASYRQEMAATLTRRCMVEFAGQR
jgi:CO/xanthine dehydrogenase FAD-binding subunit